MTRTLGRAASPFAHLEKLFEARRVERQRGKKAETAAGAKQRMESASASTSKPADRSPVRLPAFAHLAAADPTRLAVWQGEARAVDAATAANAKAEDVAEGILAAGRKARGQGFKESEPGGVAGRILAAARLRGRA